MGFAENTISEAVGAQCVALATVRDWGREPNFVDLFRRAKSPAVR